VSLLEPCPALHCTEEAGARLPPTLATAGPAAVQRLQSVQRIRTGIYINGFHCTAVEPLYSTRAGHGDSTREAGPGRCSVVGRAGKGRKGKGRAGQGSSYFHCTALHCTALQRPAVAWLPPKFGTARSGDVQRMYTVHCTELYTVHSVQRIPVYSCAASVQLLGGPWLHYEGAGSRPLQ
jgi:hypothetical protein